MATSTSTHFATLSCTVLYAHTLVKTLTNAHQKLAELCAKKLKPFYLLTTPNILVRVNA